MARPPKNVKTASFVREKIACGKGSCGTCKGTKLAHGPYWYAYWTRKDGSTGKTYVGRDLAGWQQQYGVSAHLKKQPRKPAPKTAKPPTAPKAKTKAKKPAPPKINPDWLKMTSRAATPLLAARILGVKPGITRNILTLAFKDRIKTAHPDRGGNTIEAAAVNAAYAMLKPLCR